MNYFQTPKMKHLMTTFFQEPAQGMACTAASWWRHDSEEIKARAWTDRTGYVAGQTILFSAQVENRSGKRMLGSSVCLDQKISYHAKHRTKKKKETLFYLNKGLAPRKPKKYLFPSTCCPICYVRSSVHIWSPF